MRQSLHRRVRVFPTQVGVNQPRRAAKKGPARIPHAGGGEPIGVVVGPSGSGVFPTQVGVNRVPRIACCHTARIPHAGGGEPLADLAATIRAHVFPTQVGVNRSAGGGSAAAGPYSPRRWG